MTDQTLLASVSHISMLQRPFGPRIHMDEAAAGGSPPSAPAAVPESFESADAALPFLISARSRKAQDGPQQSEPDARAAEADEPEIAAESAEDPATAEHELSGEDNAAPDEDQDHGEEEDADPVEDNQPPIARPKSWAKEDQAEWDGLPRSLQEKIAAREDARDKAIRKGQNEAAEKLKAVTAKEQAAEQARQAYEDRAKDALKVLIREQQRDFGDIKTIDDARNLAQADPFRYLQWQAHQQELQVQAQAVSEAETRAARDTQAKRTAYATAQDAKLKELVPDYADAKKLAAARDAAMPLLDEYGLSNDQLQKWAATDAGFEILQHAGFQKIISDLMKSRETDARLKAAAQAAAKKPVPPVQRPGVTRPTGQANSERVAALTTRLNNSGSLDDAVALLAARRGTRRSA